MILLPVLAAGFSGCANDPPKANFTLSPNPTSGQTVTFDGSASTGGRDHVDQPIAVSRWEWDLDGNGTFETSTSGPSTRHTYDGTKTVEVSLRVISARGATSPATTRTVVTSDQETAMAPGSYTCPAGTSDGNGCGAGAVAISLDATSDDVPSAKQPNSELMPVFRGFFGGTWADPGHPETAVAIAHGGDRVFALDQTKDVDVHDATSLAFRGEFDVTDGGRDLAYYRDEVYVLNKDGDIEVFSPEGARSRVMRLLPVDGLFGTAEPASFANLAVAWNEIWSTVSFGEHAAQGIIVRDARTGALKSAMVHRPGSDCAVTAYNQDGSHWCVVTTNRSQVEGPFPSGRSFAHAGISAVPELSALVSACRTISRTSTLGLTLGRDYSSVTTYSEVPRHLYPGECASDRITDRFMGNDAPWGMRWLLQMEHEPSTGDRIYEYSMGRGSSHVPGTEGVYTSWAMRSWQPQDAFSNNDRDITYRRGTRAWTGGARSLRIRATGCGVRAERRISACTTSSRTRTYTLPAIAASSGTNSHATSSRSSSSTTASSSRRARSQRGTSASTPAAPTTGSRSSTARDDSRSAPC